jgi:hypothetical protein
MTTNLSRGIVTLIFLRLCWRAPLMMISFIFGGYRLVAVFKEVRIGDGESERILFWCVGPPIRISDILHSQRIGCNMNHKKIRLTARRAGINIPRR